MTVGDVQLTHLPADTPVEKVIEVIERDGGVIVDEFYSLDLIKQMMEETQPYFGGTETFDGKQWPKETKVLQGLLDKSIGSHQLCLNPLWLALNDHFLTTKTTFWWGDEQKTCISEPFIHLTSSFQTVPGARRQGLHRDDHTTHTRHPDASGYTQAMGQIIAGTRVTKENGGTEVLPGSHLWPGDERNPNGYPLAYVSMEPGSAFFFLGSVYHGGGANTTEDEMRWIFSTFSCRGWVRQEENQFLTYPVETVKKFPPKLQDLLGYKCSAPMCGWVDLQEPYRVVLGREKNIKTDIW